MICVVCWFPQKIEMLEVSLHETKKVKRSQMATQHLSFQFQLQCNLYICLKSQWPFSYFQVLNGLAEIIESIKPNETDNSQMQTG